MTVTVFPATVSVPDLAPAVVGATVNDTSAEPFPLAPDETSIHGTLLTAVHAHPAAALTLTRDAPPAAGIATASGATA